MNHPNDELNEQIAEITPARADVEEPGCLEIVIFVLLFAVAGIVLVEVWPK